MSLATPPTITEQADDVRLHLERWAQPRGGMCKVMANMRHLWEEVRNPALADSAPRLLVVCGGENSRGGFNQANTQHRVDRQWTVVMMRGHGFRNLIAEEGADDNSNLVDPFLDHLEEVRDLLRSMTGISEEFPIDYKGFKPLGGSGPTPVANVFLDAYAFEFSTANDIPMITA